MIVTVTVSRLVLAAKVVMPRTLPGALLEAFSNDPFHSGCLSLSTASQDTILEAGRCRPALSGKRMSHYRVDCLQGARVELTLPKTGHFKHYKIGFLCFSSDRKFRSWMTTETSVVFLPPSLIESSCEREANTKLTPMFD